MQRRNAARHLCNRSLMALRRSFFSSQSAAMCEQSKLPSKPMPKRTNPTRSTVVARKPLFTSRCKETFKEAEINIDAAPTTAQAPLKKRLDKPKVLDRDCVSTVLEQFVRAPNICQKAAENYLAHALFKQAFQKFRTHCLTTLLQPNRPENVRHLVDLFLKIQPESPDALEELFPYFLDHCRQQFHFLNHVDELKQIADMSKPHLWYPEARAINRKIIFHAGPTNSGKTYEALEQFKKSSSGMYCAPLKLLAAEVFRKMNQSGLPCDLVTGEERRHAIDRFNPASHLAITVEMLAPEHHIDMAIIDEIQMIRDQRRGYAFTKALLGLAAPLLHVCGEEAALEVIQKLLEPTGENLEVRRYERKSSLVVSTHGLNGLENIQDGDCIVTFSQNSIISYAAKLRADFGRECALIYGDLPASIKLDQAAKFNDENNPCKVLIATDAIGMGLNLNIRRIIFASMCKYETRTNSLEYLPSYFAKQIAGRAGRFGLSHNEGVAMAMDDKNTELLKQLMEEKISSIERAGVSPPVEIFEKFQFLLPQCTFSQLMDIFSSICTLSDYLFNCPPEEICKMAVRIENIPLTMRDRYTFCLCPLKYNRPHQCSFFIKVVQRYSDGLLVSYDYLYNALKHLIVAPRNITGLQRLCDAYDCVGAYLWFSYRFPLNFPHMDQVRHLEGVIEELFTEGLELVTVQAMKSPLHASLEEDIAPIQL